jgi:hypothetical protein
MCFCCLEMLSAFLRRWLRRCLPPYQPGVEATQPLNLREAVCAALAKKKAASRVFPPAATLLQGSRSDSVPIGAGT